jgi:hypothetical protein
MFKVRVYDRSKHPVEPFFWISSGAALALLGVGSLLDAEKSPTLSFIPYTTIPLVIIVGVLRMILLVHEKGPIGEVSYMTLDEDSIQFLDKRVSISNVDKILIRINYDQVEYSRNQNNYLKIKTQSGETYRLGILISDSNDEKQVSGIIDSLKPKIKNLDYDGYL